MLVGSAVRRVAIIGGVRIPFARSYAWLGITAACATPAVSMRAIRASTSDAPPASDASTPRKALTSPTWWWQSKMS